jgi:hypothetical protein
MHKSMEVFVMKTQRGRSFILVALLILVIVSGAIISTACTNSTGDDARAETEMRSVRWTSSDSGEPLVDLNLRIYADKVFAATANDSSSLMASENAKLYFYLTDEDLSNATSKLYLKIKITGRISKTINYTSTMYIKNDNLNHEEQILDMTDYEDGRYNFTITGYTETDRRNNKHDMEDKEINLVIDKTAPTLQPTVANGGYTNMAFTVWRDTENNWDRIYVKYNGGSKTAPVTISNYSFTDTNYKASIPATSSDGWYSFIAVDLLGNQSEVYWVCLDTVAPTLKSTVANGDYTNKALTVEVEKDTEDNWNKFYVKYNSVLKPVVTTRNYSFTDTDTSITISATASNGWYSFIGVDKAGNQSEFYCVYLDTTQT